MTLVFEGSIASNRDVVRLPLTLSTGLDDVVLCPACPANALNNCTPGGDCPGNYWRLNLRDGMPISQVPEPASVLSWLAGLALLAARAAGQVLSRRPACRSGS